MGQPETVIHYAVPVQGMDNSLAIYCALLETEPTSKWCKCPWQVHPLDVDKPLAEQRMRRYDTDPDCPLHTREGLIKGFILWVTNGH